MFIPTSAYEPGFPAEWEGLDYQSAVDATPKLYGVSTGNSNDGVSHTYPDYYVRTCEPYRLAQIAIVSELKPAYYDWAIENSEVDGEAEYTISAVISDPPDDDQKPDDDQNRDHSQCEDGEDCDGCSECEDQSWCNVNGAWLIVEVFPVEPSEVKLASAMKYDSLSDAFSADMLDMIKE